MAVITISRQFGSGGDEIVERICKITNYRLFDKHLLARTAVEAGLSDEQIIDYSEDQYKVKNFLDRLFARSRPVGQVRYWKEAPDGVRTTEAIPLSEEHAVQLIRKAVQAAHQLGNVVIVGRGGQVLLANSPGVLHVRIEAPLEERIMRVRGAPDMAALSFSDSVEARRAAQARIEASDRASADYLQRFFGVDWSDPLLYHLVINSARLGIERSARLIVETAQAFNPVIV